MRKSTQVFSLIQFDKQIDIICHSHINMRSRFSRTIRRKILTSKYPLTPETQVDPITNLSRALLVSLRNWLWWLGSNPRKCLVTKAIGAYAAFDMYGFESVLRRTLSSEGVPSQIRTRSESQLSISPHTSWSYATLLAAALILVAGCKRCTRCYRLYKADLATQLFSLNIHIHRTLIIEDTPIMAYF